MEQNKNFKQIEIPVIKSLYELYRHTHGAILVFPKHEKYSLGEKLETAILESIELVITGNSQPKNFKEPFLLKAGAKTEILKLLFRLAFDCGFISQKQYLKLEEDLQEIGRMLGGWIKYVRSN